MCIVHCALYNVQCAKYIQYVCGYIKKMYACVWVWVNHIYTCYIIHIAHSS